MISYNNQFKKMFVIKKFILNFAFSLTYIRSIVSELCYLLHVHTCINNFESLLFFYNNDFFCFKFLMYQCIIFMCYKTTTLLFIVLKWNFFFVFNCVAYILIISILWTYFEPPLLKNLAWYTYKTYKMCFWHFVILIWV